MLAAALLLGACASGTTTASPTTTVAADAPDATSTTTSRPVAVTAATRTFTDASRETPHNGAPATAGRELLTRLWLPDSPGTHPVIVLAHGIGGEPDKFASLATSWARAGYAVAAPRFPASSTTGGAGIAGIQDMAQQPADVTFLLDRLLADPRLHLDATRVGIAGLSLGGSTIYALATDTCCRDPRVKVAAIFDGLRPEAFAGGTLVANAIPVLSLHCDEDYRLGYEEHAVAGFARLLAPAWLVTMRCALHAEPYEDTPSDVDDLVEQLTLDLWDGTLGGDPNALARLTSDATASGQATVQHKG